MSLEGKAARGALWTVASSIGGRAVGVIDTLAMTRFLSTDEIGEVSVAVIMCMTANWLSVWGFGQYAVVNGRGDDRTEVIWHATVLYVGLGAIALGLVALFGHYLLPAFHAESAAGFIPGMALALWIKRLGAMPERTLTMEMNFHATGVALALGELTYTVTALSFAAMGWSSMSIVIGNIAQSIVVAGVFIRAAGIRSWATPTPLRWSRIKAIMKYGWPLGVQGIAHNASRYWDNLAISHFFGTDTTGAYNMAYNLADIPAIQVGEQIAIVLLPSLAAMPHDRRGAALVRSTALLSLIIFPLAIGLGLVADPLIAAILPANRWQEVAPLLTVLACLSVFRPITWVLSAYMEAESKTARTMIIEVLKLGVLIGGIAALARYGPRASAAAVGIAFGASAIAGVGLVIREIPNPMQLIIGFLQPLVACAVMAAAVYGVRTFAHGWSSWFQLVVEIGVGAAAYVVAALVLCRTTAKDLLQLLRKALKKST